MDLHDTPTGKLTTKQEAHATGIPHRIAAVYVFNPDGRLYVQVHKASGGMLDHTVGGHVSAEETYHEAAMREMKEEISLDTPLELVAESVLEDSIAVGRANFIHFYSVFKTLAPDDWQFEPTDEVGELLLLNVDDIVKDMTSNPLKYTYGFIKTMQAYQDSLGKNWGEA